MSGAFKLLLKDLEEFRRRPNLLLFLIVSALFFLWISGNLKAHDAQFDVVFPAPRGAAAAQDIRVRALLGEFSNVTIIPAAPSLDLSAKAVAAGADLIVSRADDRKEKRADGSSATWLVTNISRPGPRHDVVQDLAYKIALSIRAMSPWQLVLIRSVYRDQGGDLGNDSAAKPVKRSGPPTPEPTQALDVGVVALDGDALSDRWLVPSFLSLITIFVPFLLASISLARERELGTLEPMLTTPGVSWTVLLVGKVLFPIFSGFIVSCVLLIFAESWFAFPVRADVGEILLFLFGGVLASACLGMAVAGVVENQLQGYFASAAYLLASILLSGFLFSRGETSGTVQALGPVLPLTWVYPPLANWMLAGNAGEGFETATVAISGQIAFFGLLAAGAFSLARRRI